MGKVTGKPYGSFKCNKGSVIMYKSGGNIFYDGLDMTELDSKVYLTTVKCSGDLFDKPKNYRGDKGVITTIVKYLIVLAKSKYYKVGTKFTFNIIPIYKGYPVFNDLLSIEKVYENVEGGEPTKFKITSYNDEHDIGEIIFNVKTGFFIFKKLYGADIYNVDLKYIQDKVNKKNTNSITELVTDDTISETNFLSTKLTENKIRAFTTELGLDEETVNEMLAPIKDMLANKLTVQKGVKVDLLYYALSKLSSYLMSMKDIIDFNKLGKIQELVISNLKESKNSYARYLTNIKIITLNINEEIYEDGGNWFLRCFTHEYGHMVDEFWKKENLVKNKGTDDLKIYTKIYNECCAELSGSNYIKELGKIINKGIPIKYTNNNYAKLTKSNYKYFLSESELIARGFDVFVCSKLGLTIKTGVEFYDITNPITNECDKAIHKYLQDYIKIPYRDEESIKIDEQVMFYGRWVING